MKPAKKTARRGPGRPGFADSASVAVRLPGALLEQLDAYVAKVREEQDPGFSRSDAVRRLVAAGLRGEK